MECFNAIRKHARDKRDKAIGKARDDYAATLVRIAALDQDLLGRDPPAHKTVPSCINRVLPNDRPFTTIDVLAALEALEPGRAWRKHSADGPKASCRHAGDFLRVLQFLPEA
jgi:hypothetical protein